MSEAFICDAIRTPFGRYGGALAHVRTDDLAARADHGAHRAQSGRRLGAGRRRDLRLRQPGGRGQPQRRAHGAAARRAAGRTCPARRSIACAARASTRSASPRARSRAARRTLMIAGGVESMTRAPFVMGKASEPFSRAAKIEDTTIGWRFVNPLMKAKYGVDSMPETAENVAAEFKVSAAPTRTRSRCAASSARPRRSTAALSRRRSCRSRPAEEGRSGRRSSGRASARDHARGAREAQADRAGRTARSPPAMRRA